MIIKNHFDKHALRDSHSHNGLIVSHNHETFFVMYEFRRSSAMGSLDAGLLTSLRGASVNNLKLVWRKFTVVLASGSGKAVSFVSSDQSTSPPRLWSDPLSGYFCVRRVSRNRAHWTSIRLDCTVHKFGDFGKIPGPLGFTGGCCRVICAVFGECGTF